MRTLYQFPLSNYCEKARWLLDHKELDYVAKNLTPGLHRPFVRYKTSKDTLPMLHDGQVWVADSTEIALYLDGMYPEQAYLRREPEFRMQAVELDQLAGVIGSHVRRWLLFYMLDTQETMDIVLGEKGLLRKASRFTTPIVRKGMRRLYRVYPDKVALSEEKLQTLIDQVEAKLLENGGKYLVSDRFGLADISVCSMTAPLIGAVGTPWEVQEADKHRLPAEVVAFRESLLARPFGQYVKRMYETERRARVDWRGV